MPMLNPSSMPRSADRTRLGLIIGLVLAATLSLWSSVLHAEPPAEPSVVTFDSAKSQEVGMAGGALSTLVGRAKDTRLMVVYGYARLVGYDQDFAIRPDILKAVEVEEGRTFTLRLRAGHRWSDGAPFTTEDLRYYWEDVANNADL